MRMKGQQLDLLSWFTDVNKATNADQAIVQDDSGEGFVWHLHPVAEVLDHLQVDPQDTIAIAVSVLLKAIIGVAQKCRVERAVATLRATPAPANDSCARHVAAHAIHLAVYRCHIHWHPGVVLYPGHQPLADDGVYAADYCAAVPSTGDTQCMCFTFQYLSGQ